jgi:hypothetical protein
VGLWKPGLSRNHSAILIIAAEIIGGLPRIATSLESVFTATPSLPCAPYNFVGRQGLIPRMSQYVLNYNTLLYICQSVYKEKTDFFWEKYFFLKMQYKDLT